MSAKNYPNIGKDTDIQVQGHLEMTWKEASQVTL
jgi:hypothetical protein